MSDQVWIALATVLAALVTALASSGVINSIQNKGKTSAERKKIEEDIITQIRSQSDKKNDELRLRLELQEYKFDMLLEEHLLLIDKVKEKCSDVDREALLKLRASALKLKFINKIPED